MEFKNRFSRPGNVLGNNDITISFWKSNGNSKPWSEFGRFMYISKCK